MQWLREVARRSPGLMTEIGLGTYADPRQQGGKFTSLAKQDLIELIEFRGKPYLFYPTFPLNVGFIEHRQRIPPVTFPTRTKRSFRPTSRWRSP